MSKFFLSIGALDSVRVTLIMSFWSTLISSIIGVSFGLGLEHWEFKGKALVIRIIRTLMGAPPVVIGLVSYMILRKKGPLGSLGWVLSMEGMIFAQVMIVAPIICGMTYSYAVSAAPAIREFAKIMGAGKKQTSMLLIREMKHELIFSVLSGYGRAISEVGAVFLVGGNIKNHTRTMTTAISTLKSAGEFQEGIILGVILMLLAFIVQTLSDYVRKEEHRDENY